MVFFKANIMYVVMHICSIRRGYRYTSESICVRKSTEYCIVHEYMHAYLPPYMFLIK